jgi:hypothetical protein
MCRKQQTSISSTRGKALHQYKIQATVENKQLHSPGLIMAKEKREKHSRSKIPQGPSPPLLFIGERCAL